MVKNNKNNNKSDANDGNYYAILNCHYENNSNDNKTTTNDNKNINFVVVAAAVFVQ